MKYYEVTFTLSPYAADAADVLAAVASEAGFETFEETPTGTIGYVQQQLFDQQALDSVIADFPFPGIAITYTVAEAEDRDWNEQWEQEGFEPIEVRGLTADGASRTLVIHDGRHLPDDAQAADISIEIDAHLAFGTGTHETTRMICATLLANEECRMKNEEFATAQPNGQRSTVNGQRSMVNVLDCGCGTGILSIVASKAGAASVVAYDIDEWSVENTLHNAQLNGADNIEVLTGDIHVLSHISGVFDIVMANINRNILLADMSSMCEVLAVGGTLMLSGFYESDVASLTEEAERLGLTLQSKSSIGDWVSLSFISK